MFLQNQQRNAVTTGDIGKLVTCLFKCSLNHFSFGVKGQTTENYKI